jgi:hypothetical protein
MSTNNLNDLLPVGTIVDQPSHDILQGLTAAALQVTVGSAGESNAASSIPQDATKDVTEQIAELNRQVTSLSATQQSQIGVTQDNTQAVTQNTVSQSGGSSSIASTVGSFASSFLGGGLTLSPIISGLISLFGGDGGSSSTVAAAPFQLPAAVQLQEGITGGAGTQDMPVDYGQGGQARAPSGSSSPQINIQVNAMDSRSFMDHSDEIASAVREAMLSSNSLNDVIADL